MVATLPSPTRLIVNFEPPSFDPAVNVNGIRKSVMPGSGFAPMRFSSAIK